MLVYGTPVTDVMRRVATIAANYIVAHDNNRLSTIVVGDINDKFYC